LAAGEGSDARDKQILFPRKSEASLDEQFPAIRGHDRTGRAPALDTVHGVAGIIPGCRVSGVRQGPEEAGFQGCPARGKLRKRREGVWVPGVVVPNLGHALVLPAGLIPATPCTVSSAGAR